MEEGRERHSPTIQSIQTWREWKIVQITPPIKERGTSNEAWLKEDGGGGALKRFPATMAAFRIVYITLWVLLGIDGRVLLGHEDGSIIVAGEGGVMMMSGERTLG